MTTKEFLALVEVINYLKDEQKHYQEEGKPESGHIWLSVQILRDYALFFASQYIPSKWVREAEIKLHKADDN